MLRDGVNMEIIWFW